MLRAVETHANATRLRHIERAAPRQMFNVNYLLSLAQALRLPAPSLINNDALRLLLDSLPLQMMWDNNFNAFVNQQTLLGNIPCVCVFHTLVSGLKALAHLVGTAIIELGNPLPIVIRCKAIRSEAGFKTDCRKVLKTIFGEGDMLISLNEDYCFGRQDKHHMFVYTCLTAGAFDFVWLHEYGHLLLGHLLKGPSHKVEFEADEFAIRTIFGAVETFPKMEVIGAAHPGILKDYIKLERTLYLSGAALSLSVLCLFDLFGQGASSTHPLGEDRVQNVAKLYPEFDLLNFVRNVHCALNPTLEEYWGVKIKIE